MNFSMSPESRNRVRKIAYALAGAAVSVGLLLLTLEALFRAFPPATFSRVRAFRFLLQPDPMLRYVLRPGLRTTIESEGGGTLLIETNEHGMRDLPYRGKEGRTVIQGFGDSYLFGDGVTRDQNLTAALQSMLDGAFPGRYRMLNNGVPGYSTNQEILHYLLRSAKEIDPDVVILFMVATDLVFYLEDDPTLIRFHRGIPVPEMVLKNDFSVDTVLPDRSPFKGWRTWEFVKFLKRIHHDNIQPPRIRKEKTKELYIEAQHFNTATFPGARKKLLALKAMLKQFKRETRLNGARLIIVYLPGAREVEDGIARRMYGEIYDYPESSWDWDLPSRAYERIAGEIGIPFVNPIPAIRRHCRTLDHSLYFRGEGHFTPEGHQVFAEIVYPDIAMILDQPMDTRPDPGEMELAFMDLRPVDEEKCVYYRIAPHESYDRLFSPRPDRRIEAVRFYVHPSSDTLILTLTAAAGKKMTLRVPPMADQLFPVVFQMRESDGPDMRMTIRSESPTSFGAILTEPVSSP